MQRTKGPWLGLILFIVLLVAGGRVLWLWLDRPIDRVSIRGEFEHVSADYLREQLAPLIEGQSWLSLDLGELRQRVRDIGWLAEVRVSRQWPDALTLELFEQEPVARWRDDALLNPRGEPFAYGSVSPPEGLADLAGPLGSGAEVLTYYDRLQRRFAALGIEIRQLRLEPRGAWRLQLDGGVWVMLGRSVHDARLARLEAAWRRQLGGEASQIRYIDLRYPNGVAVAWHGETVPVEP
ncbi:cell division protein FtsQ/DivIB [Halomonas sp. YLGW01]|uniref:cell division protein FtsQ/DivIB n=1 Tax=Halomonas sp. YLGW01 TaxID=2773308 RepID=UPI00177D883B|nr:cell division protein FtsQ/DivIB [Halomonas sp. YLGW01]